MLLVLTKSTHPAYYLSFHVLQVSVHVKGKTECYECQPKPVPKSYPVCTITSTPSKVPYFSDSVFLFVSFVGLYAITYPLSFFVFRFEEILFCFLVSARQFSNQ